MPKESLAITIFSLSTLLVPPVFGQDGAVNLATGQPIVNNLPISLLTLAADGQQCELQSLITNSVPTPPCVHEPETGLHVPGNPAIPFDGTPRPAWIGSDCVGRDSSPTYDFSFSSTGSYSVLYTGNRSRDNEFTIRETGSFTVESDEVKMNCFTVTGDFYVSPLNPNPDTNRDRNCESSVEQRIFLLADSEQRGLPLTGEFVDRRAVGGFGGLAIYSRNDPTTRLYCDLPGELTMATVAFLVDSQASDSSDTIDSGCDYSDALVNDGWGWNPQTGTSCPPLTVSPTSGCDYTDGPANSGWGWNPETMQSCPPQ